MIACPANCSVPGTLQGCYTMNSKDHCCLVYYNGMCNEQCAGDEQVANEQFVCGEGSQVDISSIMG